MFKRIGLILTIYNTHKMNLSIIFVVLSLFTELSFPLTCYRCADREQCDDENKEEMTQYECPDEEAVMCMQQIETNGSHAGKVIRRDCAVGDPKGENVKNRLCFIRRRSSLEMCICQTNLCNGNLPPCSIRLFGEDGEQGTGCKEGKS